MRVFTRLVIVAALLWLCYVLFADARAYQSVENPDPTRIVLYFGSVCLVGMLVGCIVAFSLIPTIGDHLGDAFFNPSQEIERDPHAGAMSKVAQGDFEGAIEEYRKVLESNPGDTHAISEIAHFYCDKLGDPASAAQTLEQALENEWPAEESSFLCNRLVDVYWTYQHDATRARAILIQVAENLP